MAEKNREELLTENENLRQQLETQNGLIDEFQKLVEQKATVPIPAATGSNRFEEDGKVYVVKFGMQQNGKKFTKEEIAANPKERKRLIEINSPIIKEVK